MNRDTPFEEYMPGGSQHSWSPPSQSPSSISSIGGPSKEISPLEQEVIDLYRMARLDDDESARESECDDDEYDGGVSLAGHEDTMDVDDPGTDRNTSEETPELGPSGTSINAYALPSAQEPDHDLGGGMEMTYDYLPPQSDTASILEGFFSHTAESSFETSIPQDPVASHHLSSSHPEPDVSSVLDTTQIVDNIGSITHPDNQDPDEQLFPLSSYGWHADALDPLWQLYNEQRNFSLIECLYYCSDGRALQEKYPQFVGITGLLPRINNYDIPAGLKKRKEGVIINADLDTGEYDSQGIDWQAFGVSRSTARRMRRLTYLNHTNLIRWQPQHRIFHRGPMFTSAQDMNLDARAKAKSIPDTGKYFRFSRMSLQHQICIPHFQLRHTVSASSKNAIFFPTGNRDEKDVMTTGSRITNLNPDVEDDSEVIDSAHVDPNLDTPEMNKIYALSAKNDVLVVGGLAGEYAYKSLSSISSAPFTSGMITHSELSSTNHVHTYLSRHSGLPQAVFSSNDSHVHTLDLTTNKFISRHDHVKFVNCSATSPDTRLRVLVRDAVHPLIVEADTGKRIGKLTGHNDFGFACDWADGGVHFATGAQDGLVQVFDMRSWRKPVQTLLTELGGVRSLAFSPAGNGKQVLLMAESADFVHIVDASNGMFEEKQTVDFFGEIAGVTFEDTGGRFWVGVGDPEFGGLMEFEREKKGRFGAVGGRRELYERREDKREGEEEVDVREQKKRRRRKAVLS
ncbi:MAG: hypothetical protein Q9213_006667 [Squamulea squamosa]